jgi:hypothetical protein
LLAGAAIDAAALYRCLKIVRLWSLSSVLSQSRHDEMVEEELRIANLYVATLLEIGCAFGVEFADELKVRIEAACILDPWECPPEEQGFLFPILSESANAASPARARK